MMTNWPAESAVASATVLPASRSSTVAFGAARPATTASPEGSTFTTSKAGAAGGGEAEAAASSFGLAGASLGLAEGSGALGARGWVWTTGGATGTVGGFGSKGAPATARARARFHHRKSGWVQ